MAFDTVAALFIPTKRGATLEDLLEVQAPVENMSGVRRVGDTMESAIQTWRHSDGRTITLVSCPHLANPEFYVALRAIVDKLEAGGAEVHCEGVFPSNEPAQDNDAEFLAAQAQHDSLTVQYETLPKLYRLPWVRQDYTVMAAATTWKNYDATPRDMARLLGWAAGNASLSVPLSAQVDEARKAAAGGPDSTQYRQDRKAFVLSYLESADQGMPAGHWMTPYMGFYRECIAMAAALGVPGDVVMVWHGGHFAGFAPVLKRNKFEMDDDVQWLVAIAQVDLDASVLAGQ